MHLPPFVVISHHLIMSCLEREREKEEGGGGGDCRERMKQKTKRERERRVELRKGTYTTMYFSMFISTYALLKSHLGQTRPRFFHALPLFTFLPFIYLTPFQFFLFLLITIILSKHFHKVSSAGDGRMNGALKHVSGQSNLY